VGYVRSSHPVSSFRLSLPGRGPGTGPTVVWLRGEQDIATDGELWRVLACVIGANDAAVVVDLSEVELMSASTLGVIVMARKLLRRRSRSLVLRCPSASVRRIIGICGLDDLFGPSGQKADDGAGDALGSWVAVPPSVPEDITPSVPEDIPAPVRVGVDLRARAVTVERVAEMALPKAAGRGGP
jgi:anti-anti-sigma factor